MGKEKQSLLRLLPGEFERQLEDIEKEQLERWGEAFEAWLEELERKYNRSKRQRAVKSWRDFLEHKPILPWEVRKTDVEEWARLKVMEGMQPSTVYLMILELAGFYEYVNTMVDGKQDASVKGFNPARGVKPPGMKAYKNTVPLCREEAEALLGAIDKDSSVLGKRDYALVLVHLTTGQSPGEIRKLQWKAIEVKEGEAWVDWRKGKILRRERLQDETWEAVRAYLEESGRSDTIQGEDYVFAPLADPHSMKGGDANGWVGNKPLEANTIHDLLEEYRMWAELEVEKVSCNDLRHTAVRLRLEAGEDEKNIHEWLGFSRIYTTRAYLKKLREKRVSAERREAAKKIWKKGPYQRRKSGVKKGNLLRLKYGFYAKNLPEEEELPGAIEEAIREVVEEMGIMDGNK